MNLHTCTIVLNEPKAPFNQSSSRTSLKQKRLSLSHIEKTAAQTQKFYPKPPHKICTIPAQFCTKLHCRLALDAQWLCNAACCFSTKISMAPMQNGAKLHHCRTMLRTIEQTQKLPFRSHPSLPSNPLLFIPCSNCSIASKQRSTNAA